MSFEERAEAFGFPPTDPNYYAHAQVKGRRNMTAAACLIVIVVGFLSRWAFAHVSYKRLRAKEDEQRSKRAVGSAIAGDTVVPSENLVWIKRVS
jgi:hypothetical protein